MYCTMSNFEAPIVPYEYLKITATRASLVMVRISSFPVQTLGNESSSWLKTVANLEYSKVLAAFDENPRKL